MLRVILATLVLSETLSLDEAEYIFDHLVYRPIPETVPEVVNQIRQMREEYHQRSYGYASEMK